MTTLPARHVRAAAAALGGLASLAVTACGAAVAAGPIARQPGTTATPVVISCAGQAQTRPAKYILSCGDGNAYLTGLSWSAWGSTSAFAAGSYSFKACVPSCTAGHRFSFPALAALWRAEPRPGHAGERYFTRLTVIYTGNRSYQAGGKTYHLPQTATYPLVASGGA